ncbi:MAG: T9SS type A sorting domain-containing protein [Flavobacteriales bacterium]|nr:T9SS type A sorting domain-containing protein [Flavobacteriales bacterium]
MKRFLLATLAACLLTPFVWAQEPITLCATDLMRARAIAEDPTYLEREAEFFSELDQLILNSAQQRDDEVYVIPVVFHIMHLNGRENITNEQILNAMDILNRDYDKRNADTISVHPSMRARIADMDIDFKLATRDPLGNCTNGIVRHRSAETLRGESTSKPNPWPRSKYMNIWVVDRILSGAAGYFTYGGVNWQDGIVILHDYVGSIGTGQVGRSRALTHEVGHYLSLSHVWGSNNGVPDPDIPVCAMQLLCSDDGVEDTPYTRGWSCCNASNWDTRPWGDCDRQSFKTLVDDTYETGIRYSFNGVTTGSGATDPTPVPVVVDSIDLATMRIQGSSFSAVGVSTNSSQNGRFAFTGWDTGASDGEIDFANLTGAINTGDYYQFTITPVVEQQSSIYSFTFTVGRNDQGPRTFAVRSSANNYASNLPVAGSGIAVQTGNVAFITDDLTDEFTVTIDPPTGGYTNLEQLITFRIYAWNSEDAAGSFIVDDVEVAGRSATIENVENYMEYSYCSKMFTEGQRTRARAALQSTTTQRANLWTEENLSSTGLTVGAELSCPPQADFYAQVGTDPANPAIPFAPYSCTNTNVRFYDNTALSFPTEWSWTFQDGTPATSNQRNPTVQFSSTGWKTVTLTVTNANGSSTKTDSYAVHIGGPDAAIAPHYESFEQMQGEDPFPFTAFNYEDNFTQFRRFTGGGATGNACVWLNSGSRNQLDFIDPDNVGDYDDFITPLYNLSGAPSATLSFRYAYSTNTTVVADISELLDIDSSTDCGRTWLDRATITGTQLVTNGTSAAVPPQNWTLRTISLPGSVMSQNVRFRFRFVSSSWSNNLYIDDIWIGVPVGINELGADGFISLYPNPSNDQFNVQVAGMESSPTEITITDMRGAVVFRKTFQPQGGASIEISGHEIGLAEGMYLLRAQNALGSSGQKLVMNH